MRKIVCGVCLIAVCFALCGCVASVASERREYKIFCGMSSPGGEVSEKEWARFCDEHVSAAFPDGYTVLDAAGYWRSAPQTTAKERSKIILIVAPADAREKVLSVARRYRERFAQDCVLVSVTDAEAELVRAKR